MGCGRLFEGSPEQMWDSLSQLAALPGETVICSGHEYTAANARFGNGVAVSEGVLVVGEPRSDLPRPNAGAAHVYFLGPALSWSLRETLEGTTIQPDVPLFGNQVGISDQMVVSGAPGEDVGAFLSAGAGWVFDLQLDIFADGFESGDTNAWTLAVPSP